jgi:hypothetical protein
VPFVRPGAVKAVAALPVLDVAVDQVKPELAEYSTAYPLMLAPPLDAGAIHVSATDESADVPVTAVGASGTVDGVTGDEVADADPVPTAFVARTRNV